MLPIPRVSGANLSWWTIAQQHCYVDAVNPYFMCLTWNYLIRRYLVLIQIFVGNAFCVLCFVATSFRKTAFTVSGLTCCFNFSWLWWSRRQRCDLMQKLGEVFIIWSENCFLDLVMKRVAGKLSARLEPNSFLSRPIFCRCCCTLLLQAIVFLV